MIGTGTLDMATTNVGRFCIENHSSSHARTTFCSVIKHSLYRSALGRMAQMIPLFCYLAIAVVAVTWCMSDTNATGAYEVLRRSLHATAHDMGAYGEWLSYSLPRCVVLFTLVGLSTGASFLLLQQNPFGLGQLLRTILFATMLIGSLGLLLLPYVCARVRFRRYLVSKAAEFSKLASLCQSEEETLRQLEPANYHTDDKWTAWHPKMNIWKQDECWADIVPVVYLRREPVPSLIVPVDWQHFLAWNFPSESCIPGQCLPVHGPGVATFSINATYKLPGRPGWSVVSAALDVDAV